MARSVNLFTGAVTTTGSNPATPQYQMPVTFQWTDNAGVDHSVTGTAIVAVAFSYKDAGNVVHPVNAALLKDDMVAMIVNQARIYLGVDA